MSDLGTLKLEVVSATPTGSSGAGDDHQVYETVVARVTGYDHKDGGRAAGEVTLDVAAGTYSAGGTLEASFKEVKEKAKDEPVEDTAAARESAEAAKAKKRG